MAFEARLIERSSVAVENALIGDHPTIRKLRALIERVARHDVTVLITGESGTGKEIVAQSIHESSLRRERPFVPVNCAAIPHDLLESEMFGHQRGAFTGAGTTRAGLFMSAEGGTIFLDEISELPQPLQAKLLRVLEDGVVRPVGSDHGVRVDVRVIAASNADLGELIARNAFREDLFYRLQVVPITIPPLRERRSDIPLLVDHFLARTRRQRAAEGPPLRVSDEAMVLLWSYDWPGNVRELENLVERMVILCEGKTIEAALLPSNIASVAGAAEEIPTTLDEEGLDLNVLVRKLEGRLINQALKQTSGNKQAAARLLGLKRTTFAAKLRRCGVIAPTDSDSLAESEVRQSWTMPIK
ncbi:MAG TPA: sigma-54 dependent transcriptional regulator [Candidatus Binataceae bacterium]|nr:sigma-54 dependent transcriptional regulator [Candidatus Binataceae bacterium]